jgi:N-methylhydantoinase B
VDALADAEFVRAGEVIRIRTTGGGGWGDPLDRDPQAVVRDVRWGKVSRAAALDAYGVVLIGEADSLSASLTESDALRQRLRAARGGNQPFFDRGPGYEQLSGGATSSEFDWLPD